ncbi:sodium:panthothenate symporter [Ruficoccus amylovorans]|uniref:Sodium:panthothenate symporter n=1 Tax=Ruficoccus amylovorans TaxID=1804625 RepID=A0A842HFC0_9BACT|nr:sodium:panthothenate symporter [Ruficoccus amylovorans]MBC2595325.1 sodium:panthothenate symporter [Ruficoccus amylovorans]
MHWLDWLIIIIPVLGILWAAVHSRRYVRGVADYLAASRVAGRYVISVADLSQGLGVITLVALVEAKYQTGYALTFWEYLLVPVSTIMGLTGYCVYRFRETKALSIGQFLEMRYSRSFRIVAATLRTLSEMLTNAIGPAIATNFFIYYMGLPHEVMILGVPIPCFAIIVALMLTLCIIVMWPGGRISLLITDCIQSLLSYPVFVIVAGYIVLHFSWSGEISPVMLDRVPNESFLNPFDISELRDFNIFALVVTIVGMVLNRASWIGNDTTNCGRTPHEQKIAGILGSWRTGFSTLMCLLIAVMVITLMSHGNFSDLSRNIRLELADKVSQEAISSPYEREALMDNIQAIPAVSHQIGVDAPLSQAVNLDTPYLEAARSALSDDGQGNLEYQKFRTLYNQMMLPVALRNLFPVGLIGIFGLLMVMLMLSTDDSRIFNSSSTIIQDIILPLKKKPLTPEGHLKLLRWGSVGVAVFFLICSLFFVHLDYINMFITIMTAVWLGGAGPIMIFGLYSRFGTTTGAYCSLLFGSGFSIASLFVQREWADTIYPFLLTHGWVTPFANFLQSVSAPFNPYIEWKMSAVKFPINSYELYFMSMGMGVAAYIIGSLLTCREPFNLDRMLHRGKYNIDGDVKPRVAWTWGNFASRLVGITPEYTRGDKIIAWSVFGYAIIYKLGFCFILVLVWNLISPWSNEWWSTYFFFTSIVVTGVVGIVSTVWFGIGGVVDLRRLFKDLKARVDNPLDDGRVVGHISLADQAAFEAREKEEGKES